MIMLPFHMPSSLLAVWGPPDEDVTSVSSCLTDFQPPSSHKSLELLFNPLIFSALTNSGLSLWMNAWRGLF